MKYFRENKQKIFPEIKDWTDPQDKYRYSNNVKAMDYKHWFFLTPSAYHLIRFGINSIASVLFLALFIYSVIRENRIISIISFIMFLFNFLALINKIKNYATLKNMTLYDLWMREYKEDEK